MEKDCIKKQGNSLKHQEGLKLIQKNELKGEAYNYFVIEETTVGRNVICKCASDRKSLITKKMCLLQRLPHNFISEQGEKSRHWKIMFEQHRRSRLYRLCM